METIAKKNKLEKEYVVESGLDFMTIEKFIEKYHKGLSKPAIVYAIDNGKIDFMKPGYEKFVVITTRTMAYKPNPHPSRKVN